MKLKDYFPIQDIVTTEIVETSTISLICFDADDN